MTPPDVLQLEERFRGAVLGMAIGDALGFPLRGVPRAGIAAMPDLAEDFSPRPRGKFQKGQFSDDTQVMLAVAESVIAQKRIDGRSAGSHLAWLWQEGVLLQPSVAVSESIERLRRGIPWMSAGAAPERVDPSALSRALIVGLWSRDDPSRLAHDAGVLTVLTHKSPRCAAAASAYARAISLAFEPERRTARSFCEAIAKAASVHDTQLADELMHLPRVLPWDETRAFELLRRVSVPNAVLADSDGLPSHVTPVLLTVLFVALKLPHDFKAAMRLLLLCGGETDASAALLGGLLGAHLGAEALPSRYRKNVLYGEHLTQLATRLSAASSSVHVAEQAVATSRAHSRR